MYPLMVKCGIGKQVYAVLVNFKRLASLWVWYSKSFDKEIS